MIRFRAKKSVFIVAFSFFVSSCSPSYYSTAFCKINLDKHTIAVLPFDNESVDFDATPIFRHAIYNYLSSRGFDMIPLDRVDKILAEQGVRQGGEVWGFTQAELGELLCADYILYGTVTEFNTKYILVYSSINVEGRFELYDTSSEEKVWESLSGSHSNNFTRIFFVGDLIELLVTLDIKEFITNNDLVKIFKKSYREIISEEYLKKNVKYTSKSGSCATMPIDPQAARLVMDGARIGIEAMMASTDSKEALLVAGVIFLTWTLLYAMFDNYDNYVIELVVEGFKNFPA
jgi:hypothetical protein